MRERIAECVKLMTLDNLRDRGFFITRLRKATNFWVNRIAFVWEDFMSVI